MSIAAPVLGLIGSIASGIGSMMAAKSQRKAEEKAKIAEEKRREARYAGIGEAASVKDPTQADLQLGRSERQAQRVGARPERVGDRYDRDADLAGLGRRPDSGGTPAGDIPSAVSVSQGAAPMLSSAAANAPGAGQPQAAPPKPRYSYNPQTQRIDFGSAQQAPLPAVGLPPRPNLAGAR